jgi:peroxiredoxin Q/BCP
MEVCALRDAAPRLGTAGVTVFGISRDDVRSQARFKKEQKLTFALLSDPDGSVTRKFGAAMKGRPFARRVTFLIDDKGVLRQVLDKVDVRAHGDQILAAIAKLRE